MNRRMLAAQRRNALVCAGADSALKLKRKKIRFGEKSHFCGDTDWSSAARRYEATELKQKEIRFVASVRNLVLSAQICHWIWNGRNPL